MRVQQKFRKFHPTVFVVGLSMLPLCQHTQLQGPEVLLTQPWDCHGSLNERELSWGCMAQVLRKNNDVMLMDRSCLSHRIPCDTLQRRCLLKRSAALFKSLDHVKKWLYQQLNWVSPVLKNLLSKLVVLIYGAMRSMKLNRIHCKCCFDLLNNWDFWAFLHFFQSQDSWQRDQKHA